MSLATERLNRLPAAERGITIGDFLVPISVGERLGTSTRHLALVVAGAAVIALTANLGVSLHGETLTLPGDIRVSLPNSPVPATAQTFSVLLVAGALGFRRGIISTLLYLLLGLLLPVYADGKSGLDTYLALHDGRLVLGATGGYLLGFVLASAVVGRLAELGWDRHVGGAVSAMIIGNLAVYIVGVPWLMLATGFDLPTAIDRGLAPFVFGDLAKVALAGIAFPVAWWMVGRRTGEG